MVISDQGLPLRQLVFPEDFFEKGANFELRESVGGRRIRREDFVLNRRTEEKGIYGLIHARYT